MYIALFPGSCDYLLRMMPVRLSRGRALYATSPSKLALQILLGNVTTNPKSVYRVYTNIYSTTLGFWLHEMQLVVAHTCSEYAWSLLNKL